MNLELFEKYVGTSSLFENRSFLMYWLSYLFSALGDAIYFFVIPWTIKELTGSGTMMGTFLLTVGVPRVVLMLFGGVAVDRFDGRRIMILSDLLRAIVMVGMLALMVTNQLNMKLILGLGFIFGVLDAFYWPAVTSIRQRIVKKEHYVQSNSLLAGTWQVSVFIGPVIGSFLYQIDNGKTCIVAIICALILSAFTLRFVRLKKIEKKKNHIQKSSIREDLSFGIKYISKNQVLLIIIFMMLFANSSFNMLQVGLAFLAKSFHANANEFGLMQSALGAGGLLVSFVLSFIIIIKNPSPRANMFAVSFQGLGLLTLGLTSHY